VEVLPSWRCRFFFVVASQTADDAKKLTMPMMATVRLNMCRNSKKNWRGDSTYKVHESDFLWTDVITQVCHNLRARTRSVRQQQQFSFCLSGGLQLRPQQPIFCKM
jgi:hypothetical protein